MNSIYTVKVSLKKEPLMTTTIEADNHLGLLHKLVKILVQDDYITKDTKVKDLKLKVLNIVQLTHNSDNTYNTEQLPPFQLN